MAVPLVLLLIVAGLLVMPAKRSVSLSVRVDVGLAWFAALSTLVLVPTDIAHALQARPCWLPRCAVFRGRLTPASAPAQGDKPMLLSVWWRAAYWYGFVAQFTVLPFHQARGVCCGPGRVPRAVRATAAP